MIRQVEMPLRDAATTALRRDGYAKAPRRSRTRARRNMPAPDGRRVIAADAVTPGIIFILLYR